MSVFEHQPREGAREEKGEMSTAARFYDMEESQRRYQELVEENVWLKQQIERNKPADTSSRCPQCSDCAKEKQPPSQNADIALWSMLERNRFLEDKIGKLKGQY
jgi:hypothetical protein